MEEPLSFRRALGAFTTGVVVISAPRAGGGLCGITVNSFASVSLAPPLVLWSLGDQSERYDVFSVAETWGATILGANEQALARRFARPEEEAMRADEAEDYVGVPVLKGGIAHFACRTHERRVAGDHLVIMGEVLSFRVSAGPALTFFRGRYGVADEGET